jgi:hypothetical protein
VALGKLISSENGSTKLDLINELTGTHTGTIIVYVEKN